MPELRSRVTTHGRNAAGARSLWRATGMTDGDFGKPIVAIANSYTQFVPGHVHLRDLGDIVAEAIREAGGVAREFHTIAVDDGIAMGHGGMLYSLPSREIIADSVEYMVNAHAADALVCISNCDKITPGMLNAAMRLNVPTVFVSGGPMEAGKAVVLDGVAHASSDLITTISASANDNVDEAGLSEIEKSACPTCGSCSGMFTANSMNCLTEALGLALPGNGSTLATHAARRDLFARAGTTVMDLCRRWYGADTTRRCPARSPPATRSSTRWRSTWRWAARRTRCCTSSRPHARARSSSPSPTSTRSAAGCRACRRSSPNSSYHMEDVHRAGGIPAILGELWRAGLLNEDVHTVHSPSMTTWLGSWDIRAATPSPEAVELYHAAPGGVRTTQAFSRRTAGRRWTRTRRAAASGTPHTRTPSRAGSRCCTATSPRTAR